MLGEGLGHLLLGPQTLQHHPVQARGDRQRHAGAGAHRHGLPDRGEVQRRLAFHLVQRQVAAPALLALLEAHPGEARDEALVAHGQDAGIEGDALAQLAAARQAEALGEQFVAVEQYLQVFAGRSVQRAVVAFATIVEEHPWVRQQQQPVALGQEQHRLVVAVAQAIDRGSRQLADLAQLLVVGGDMGQRLEHPRQAAALEHHHEVAQAAVGAAPEGDLGRLVEQFLDQAVLQGQVVLVDDPPQRTGQAEAVAIVLVIEDEVLGQGIAQQRHLEDFLRQAAQRHALDQRVGLAQVTVGTWRVGVRGCLGADRLAEVLFGRAPSAEPLQPAHLPGQHTAGGQRGDDPQHRPQGASGARSGGRRGSVGRAGGVVLAHGSLIPCHPYEGMLQ